MFSSFTEHFKCFYLSRRDFADSYTKFTFVNVFAPGNVIRKSMHMLGEGQILLVQFSLFWMKNSGLNIIDYVFPSLL